MEYINTLNRCWLKNLHIQDTRLVNTDQNLTVRDQNDCYISQKRQPMAACYLLIRLNIVSLIKSRERFANITITSFKYTLFSIRISFNLSGLGVFSRY